MKSWKRTKMNIKYANVLELKSDRGTRWACASRSTLLISEFGQDVGTLDEYVAIYLGPTRGYRDGCRRRSGVQGHQRAGGIPHATPS